MNSLLILMLTVPLLLVIVNATLNRLALGGSAPLSPHVSPFMTAAVVNVVVLPVFVIRAIWLGGDLIDTICGSLALLTWLNCLAFLNWFWFTVTDVSMHVHLLVEIHQRGAVSPEALLRIYNKSAILSARLPRLLELKQLRLQDGRLYVQSSAVLLGAQVLVLLRRILGIPARPEDAQRAAAAGGIPRVS